MPIEEAKSVNTRPTISGIRVTATETIDGVLHVIVPERQDQGRYREVSIAPLGPV